MMLKVLLFVGLLFCYFENYSTLVSGRKKRDNESILYGNQQGSPHLSVKKSGQHHHTESGMHEHHSKNIEHPSHYQYVERKNVLKRAKRTLVQNALENSMVPNQIRLRRKKRSIEDIDPETLAQLRSNLEAAYDSYYDNAEPSAYLPPQLQPQLVEVVDENDGRTELEPVIEEELPAVYQEDRNVPDYEVLSDPYYEDQVVDEPVKRMMPLEIPVDNEEQIVEEAALPSEDNIPYDVVEVNGVPGLFLPLVNPNSERNLEKRLWARKRNTEELAEDEYNSKLSKLAKMLAMERKK